MSVGRGALGVSGAAHSFPFRVLRHLGEELYVQILPRIGLSLGVPAYWL